MLRSRWICSRKFKSSEFRVGSTREPKSVKAAEDVDRPGRIE